MAGGPSWSRRLENGEEELEEEEERDSCKVSIDILKGNEKKIVCN